MVMQKSFWPEALMSQTQSPEHHQCSGQNLILSLCIIKINKVTGKDGEFRGSVCTRFFVFNSCFFLFLFCQSTAQFQLTVVLD